jgi:transposase
METKEKEIIYSERTSNQQPFDKRLIAHIVSLTKQGVPRKDLIKQFGMSKWALNQWLRKSDTVEVRKSYPTSQKRSVVRAVASGMSIKQAAVAFNISSGGIIRKWMTVFKEENSDLSVSKSLEMKQKPKNTSQSASLIAMQKELAQAKLQIKALDTLIDIAEEQLKIDIRKKSGARQS